MRWEQPGGQASMGARTLANDCSPEIVSLPKLCAGKIRCADPLSPGRRPKPSEKKRVRASEGHRGVGGPSAHARIAEITSGRAISQQGLATTCKDSSDEGKPEVDERDLAWRMSLSERRRRGNAFREDPGDPPRRGNTPTGQRGSRHLAGSRPPPDRAQNRANPGPEGTSRAAEQTTPARGGCAPALEFRLRWEGTAGTSQGRQPDSGNPTVRDENGGLGKRGYGSRTAVRRRKPRRHHRTLQRARPRSIQTQSWLTTVGNYRKSPSIEFPYRTRAASSPTPATSPGSRHRRGSNVRQLAERQLARGCASPRIALPRAAGCSKFLMYGISMGVFQAASR
jgi:hypothetical protein